MARDPWGVRNELRERIRAAVTSAEPDNAVDAIMALFYDVDEEWHRIDVTALSDPGQSFLDQRWIIARIPVQVVPYERPVDRPPVQFRISRVETHIRHLSVIDTSELTDGSQ